MINPDAPRILPKRHTSLGWAVVEVGFEVVPGYDLAEAKRGLSQQSIQTELYRNWMASQNKAVYPEFSQQLHVVKLEYDPDRPLFVGLDVPGTPAAVITQLDAFGRWCVLSNLSPPEDETIGYYDFFAALADHLWREYADPAGVDLDRLDVQFYGDPAGRAKIPRPGESPREARSCWDILRDGVEIAVGRDERGREIVETKPGWGWRVKPGVVNITDRLESVRARLTTILRGGVPAFAIDPSCRTVIEAMAGAYCYKQRSTGSMAYELDPCKDFYSHTADCLGYLATRLFAPKPRSAGNDDDDAPHVEPFRSQAAASGRGRGGDW